MSTMLDEIIMLAATSTQIRQKTWHVFKINKISAFNICTFSKASELRAYIKSKGAEISEENSEGGLHVDLAQIIEACDVCLKDDDKGQQSSKPP